MRYSKRRMKPNLVKENLQSNKRLETELKTERLASDEDDMAFQTGEKQTTTKAKDLSVDQSKDKSQSEDNAEFDQYLGQMLRYKNNMPVKPLNQPPKSDREI
jgi:hypothetical protein